MRVVNETFWRPVLHPVMATVVLMVVTLVGLTRIIQTCVASCEALFLQRIQYPRFDVRRKIHRNANRLSPVCDDSLAGYHASRRPCIQYPSSRAGESLAPHLARSRHPTMTSTTASSWGWSGGLRTLDAEQEEQR